MTLRSPPTCSPPWTTPRIGGTSLVLPTGRRVAGLAAVGLAVSAAVLLVTGYVTSAVPAGLITAFVTCMFGMLWLAFPLARRR